MSHIISHYDNSCTKMKTNMQLNMHVWIISSKANESHPTPHYSNVATTSTTTKQSLQLSPKPLLFYMLHCTFNCPYAYIRQRKTALDQKIIRRFYT
uniref:Uncharacterized protein n=1 Tax=Populus trichocarpa TaxID=3694 RepID=A0A2K1X6S3_POPTR